MILGKGADGVRHQWALDHVYEHVGMLHAGVRLPVAQPQRTTGTGAAPRWQPRTPAMAAGLTDHVWSL